MATLPVTPPPSSPPAPSTFHGRGRSGYGQSPTSRLTIRRRLRGKKLFDPVKKEPPPEWTQDEESKLVEFLLLFTDGKSWVMHKHSHFWAEAGKHVQQSLHLFHCRSGNACRKRVIKLSSRFSSPEEASHAYAESGSRSDGSEKSVSSMQVSPPSDPLLSRGNYSAVLRQCKLELLSLEKGKQLEALSQLFSDLGPVAIPLDFLKLVCAAVHNLRANGRSNMVYQLARCLGTCRSNSNESLLPVKTMPTGLIEYTLNFFNAESIQQITCPQDYRLWQETMYTLFGMKWVKIHGGPMWGEDPVAQGSAGNRITKKPVEARVNIPALSDRTLRRGIASSGYTLRSEIQTGALDQACASFPTDTQWWIKGDAVDIVAGLGESVRGEWSGDVDLNDGRLQKMFEEYQGRLKFIKSISISDCAQALTQEKQELKQHLDLFSTKLVVSNEEYQDKLGKGKKSEKAMFELAWKVEELDRLCKECRSVLTELNVLLDRLQAPESISPELNIPQQLTVLKQRLALIVKALYKWKREPATHVFVFMISCEQRNHKPYAIPVQCIPCTSLKEKDLRILTNALIAEMAKRKMKVVGSVSNGEFNVLRYKGYTRPLSVFKIRSDVRAKYSRLSQKVMIEMLTPLRLPDGTVQAKRHNDAISSNLILDVWKWKCLGASDEDIISRLRSRTVPSGYSYSPWKPGKSETTAEMLRSILAQLEYTYLVQKWDSEGVPFRQHVYVPEVHPLTLDTYHEREDEPHVLKRIASSTREGGPAELRLERFLEALSCPSTNLTYTALSGARKQSVQDAERMFNPGMVDFMRSQGYNFEAAYLSVIGNWRRSCDQRGLTPLQRCRFNYQLLSYILVELIPWYTINPDLSLMEVNRDISKVCGFSRQTLIAITTNIESRERKRIDNVIAGRPQEHPRASTSDDCECFFSVLRDNVGKNFSLKEVKYNFRKVCVEFGKRIDPDLPYFYHTSYHSRFAEGELPSFDKTPRKPRKDVRVPRREQTAAFVPGRVTLPVRGSLSKRPQFHNKPIELPPPPSAPIHLFEHSYANK